MRRVRYAVAMSLDGYIAGPEGEFDWIVMDPDIDFADLFDQFDTALLGRKTYEVMRDRGEAVALPGMQVYVFSRTLHQLDHPDVTVSASPAQTVAALKAEPGKDIWLFGGGGLFRSLLGSGLVDSVEVAIIPVMLGDGIPISRPPATLTKLELTRHRVYEKTGTVALEYTLV